VRRRALERRAAIRSDRSVPPSRKTPALKTPKVFCIGFHKTGTSSLGRALELLGYRVCGPIGTREPDIAARAEALACAAAERHDAFQDNPWAVLYRELDRRFPGSRFVLSTRPSAEWIASATRHFGSEDTPIRAWIYGVGHPLGHEARYVERYERHNREVRAHFAERPQQLLELALGAPDPWGALCAFLGAERPTAEFPWLNRAARPTLGARLRRRLGR